MTVDKLSRLIPALGQTAQSASTQKTEIAEGQAAPGSSSAEAVKLADHFGVEESDDAGRREKVAQLKKAVAEGTYKPDSAEIAKAVARDLFA